MLICERAPFRWWPVRSDRTVAYLWFAITHARYSMESVIRAAMHEGARLHYESTISAAMFERQQSTVH